MFLCCKKEHKNNFINTSKEITQRKFNNDTILIKITDNYDLDIIRNSHSSEKINFFQPIKDKLINEEIYSQVLYNSKNIILSVETPLNIDEYYEDIYISKKEKRRRKKFVNVKNMI
ncbi:hypothetical protein ACM39_03960 [Chryseobacterium sp. FH2]|nr:hypothetical protein ACM39_03960 [Chryseobacterium sp. FH2]